jgi:CPA2 family monovalent cation:H+ antiporter-2
MATTLTRRWLGQMALNAALIAAVFIAAAFAERHPPGWLVSLGLDADWLKAVLWLAAVIISLPMFIATFRKLQALGLLIAETKVSEAAAGERTTATRAVVAQVVPIAGSIALGLLVLVLSSALLPSFKVLVVLLVIVAFITWLLWRSFIKVYSKAQVALQETFAQPAAPRHDPAPATLPSLLREADLETVTLGAGSPGVGRLIRELELRTRTGASIVGIERGGANIINPGPDEELQSGDQLLLLGTPAQLRESKKVFQGNSN